MSQSSAPHAPSIDDNSERISEANYCLSLGVGVGALGAAGALATGAVCPLCIFIAPALIGVGVLGRIRNSKAERASSATPFDPARTHHELVDKS